MSEEQKCPCLGWGFAGYPAIHLFAASDGYTIYAAWGNSKWVGGVARLGEQDCRIDPDAVFSPEAIAACPPHLKYLFDEQAKRKETWPQLRETGGGHPVLATARASPVSVSGYIGYASETGFSDVVGEWYDNGPFTGTLTRDQLKNWPAEYCDLDLISEGQREEARDIWFGSKEIDYVLLRDYERKDFARCIRALEAKVNVLVDAVNKLSASNGRKP